MSDTQTNNIHHHLQLQKNPFPSNVYDVLEVIFTTSVSPRSLPIGLLNVWNLCFSHVKVDNVLLLHRKENVTNTADKTHNGRSKFSQQTRGVPPSVPFETWMQPQMERLSDALLKTSGLKLTRSATAGNLTLRLTMQIKQQPPSPPAPGHVDSRCAWWGIKIEVGGGG